MIKDLQDAAVGLARRLWSKDPETRLRAWGFCAGLVLLAFTTGYVTGHFHDIRECVTECYPQKASFEQGVCYCATGWVAPE